MIHDPFPNQPLVGYQVSVGHFTVKVEGRTKEEAITAARRQLCRELPRMWDVIQSLETSRFEFASNIEQKRTP
jgi:hypothetical protein